MSNHSEVKKAIIPITGMGTRMYPHTKSNPKELLPIINKPVIQHIVEEAVESGITEIILVVGEYEQTVRDYFERNHELEAKLIDSGREELAEVIASISNLAKFTFTKNTGPYGNATAVSSAKDYLNNEPFILFWADDFFVAKKPRAKQLIDKFNQYGSPVISLVKKDLSEMSNYGVASINKTLDPSTFSINGLVEKPALGEAPSEYASVGGYLLTPDIIPIIEDLVANHSDGDKEIYLSTAIDILSRKTEVLGTIIDGRWHDTGTKEGYFRAIIDVGSEDPSLRKIAQDVLNSKR